MRAMQTVRGPRRVLLVTGVAAALAAGGAGVAYASNDPAPVETGYAVVGASDTSETQTETQTQTQAQKDEECEERRNRQQESPPASPSDPAPSDPAPSAPAPSEPAPSDAQGRL